MRLRHAACQDVFFNMASYAPAFGMLGTVGIPRNLGPERKKIYIYICRPLFSGAGHGAESLK